MKFIILGCGSSMGVPRIDGFFGNCNPKNPKNYRTRCSALIKSTNQNILIDTSPDLREQLLKNNIKNIDSVIYTHNHADQTHGINDLRVFFIKNRKKIPVYADKITRKYLYKSFSYCFENYKNYPAILEFVNFKKKISFNKSLIINPITVQHGSIKSSSFIINKTIAYLPDVNMIYKKDFRKLSNLNYKKHSSHFNIDDVLELNIKLKPKKMILTNLHSDLDYDQLLNILPKNIKPAYDGLTINFK